MNITHRRFALAIVLALLLSLAAACKPAGESGPTDTSGTYKGVPVGLTSDGYVYMGSLDAPVIMQEFTDYVCPYCARHVAQVEPSLIEQYIKVGQVQLVFRDNPIAGLHPTSSKGHEATFCAAEQSAEYFWAMHARLFAEQATWGALPDPAEYLSGLAKEAGVDMKDYQACLDSGRAKTSIDATIAEATAYGYSGTPMFRVSARDSEAAFTVRGAQALEAFSAIIDPLLAGETPAVVEPTPPPEAQLPLWARPEGLAADPERPGYNLAGDAFKGDPSAALVVVEFSDYQCPVCRSHTLEVQPALDEQFVDTGKVMWVFKNLPLRIHPQASTAAAAAECAGAQDAFWPMHDRLYTDVEAWSVDAPEPALQAIAADLGLDADTFASCLNSRWAMDEVVADLYDAQDVSNSTPLFVALYGGQGQLINGSMPVEKFSEALSTMLAEATGDAAPTAAPAP
ncbi:MAG: DsbA family protein [Anaerolineae bacterium]